MSKLQLNPNGEVEFCFRQEQADGSVIEYAGTAQGLSMDVVNEYDEIYTDYDFRPMNKYLRDTTVTATFHNPKGTFKKTPKTGVVRTATVIIDSLTPHNIDEARRKCKVSSDFEFTVDKKVNDKTLRDAGYSIKFVWTD